MCQTWWMIQTRIWIRIEMESRIRIGIKRMPVHNTRHDTKKILTKIKQSDCDLAHFTFCCSLSRLTRAPGELSPIPMTIRWGIFIPNSSVGGAVDFVFGLYLVFGCGWWRHVPVMWRWCWPAWWTWCACSGPAGTRKSRRRRTSGSSWSSRQPRPVFSSSRYMDSSLSQFLAGVQDQFYFVLLKTDPDTGLYRTRKAQATTGICFV